MFQKYVSDSKNLKGIYEYDRGVQGSENLLFYKEIDTFNKLGYKAKINTHTTSYIN